MRDSTYRIDNDSVDLRNSTSPPTSEREASSSDGADAHRMSHKHEKGSPASVSEDYESCEDARADADAHSIFQKHEAGCPASVSEDYESCEDARSDAEKPIVHSQPGTYLAF